MRRRDFAEALVVGLASGVLPRAAGAASGERRLRLVERWSWAMGQPVHLQLFAPSDDQGYGAAAAALGELRRVEALLSRFDDASELSELNRRAGRGPLRLGADLMAVLVAAEGFRRSSGGAFNIAVEPLMRSWGFHAPRAAEPSPAELAEARAAVRAAEVRLAGNRVVLPSVHTQLDLGGIGVGYGLDRMGVVLRAHGIGRAFLDVSGDCLALGAPPGERGWRVAIADPAGGEREVAELRIADRALATSANSVSVVRFGRRLRGHVMDPATGFPAERLTQVSAAAASGLAADALSTAMLVSGRREDGVEWSWEVRPVPGRTR
jgi:FAD:protein FMN transferase